MALSFPSKSLDLLLPAVGVVRGGLAHRDLDIFKITCLLPVAYGLSDLEVCIAFASPMVLVLVRS